MIDTHLPLERDRRGDLLCEALKGRRTSTGYALTTARAAKMTALHAGGYWAIRYGRGWRFFRPGSSRLLLLNEAMRENENAKPLDGVTVER